MVLFLVESSRTAPLMCLVCHSTGMPTEKPPISRTTDAVFSNFQDSEGGGAD